ncbi:MAG: hypothetical protein K6T71_01990, partial [Candidatus Bipolaricaulota bacterium]|nr:hypothetical protein [Candidatus Bipolaricaulota bacterium]
IAPGDPAFKSLAEQLVALTPKNRLPMVGVMEMCEWIPPWGPPPILIPCRFLPLESVKECGSTIADTLIDPEAPKDPLAAARSLDDGPPLIGAARSYDDGSFLLGRAPLPRGGYYVWMAEAGKLGVKPPPEMIGTLHWFIFIGHVKPPPEMMDITAILYYPDEKFRTADEWLNIIGALISLKDRGCDLTVRHLSVRATKITPPCTIPPCPPPQWEIMALAIVANIGQIDVKDSFTVRVLLNGRIIHEEEIAELAAGASRPALASATVDKPGRYIVMVMVDLPMNKIKELNEANNIAVRGINVR